MLKYVLIYTPARIVPAAIGLLTLGVFTRVLDPDQYGYFALAASVAFTLDGFFGQWLLGAIMRFHAGQANEEDAARLLASCGLLFAIPGLVVCVAGAVIVLTFWAPGTEQTVLLLALPYFLIYSLQQMVMRVHIAAMRSLRFAVLNVLQAAVSAGAAMGLAAFAASHFAGASFAAQAPALATAGVISGYALVLLIDWPATRLFLALDRARRPVAQEIANFAWPIMAGSGLALVTAYLNRFVLLGALGAGAVGLYNAAQILSEQAIASVFAVIATAANPITVMAQERETAEALQSRLRNNAIWIFGLGAPSAVGLAMVSPELGALFLGEAFRASAVETMPLFAAGAFLNGVRMHFVIHSYFLARKLHFNLYMSAFAFAVTIAANYLLIPGYGVMGAVAAMLATEIAALILAYALTFRAVRLPLPFLDMGRIALASAAMAAALYSLPALPAMTSLIIKLSLGVAVFGAACLALNVDGAARKLLDRLNPPLLARQTEGAPHDG